MILPEFQNRGIASQAVREVLEKARTGTGWPTPGPHPNKAHAGMGPPGGPGWRQTRTPRRS